MKPLSTVITYYVEELPETVLKRLGGNAFLIDPDEGLSWLYLTCQIQLFAEEDWSEDLPSTAYLNFVDEVVESGATYVLLTV
jgi:hypothetical protein